MTPELEQALAGLRHQFADQVEVTSLPDGGVKVVVNGLELGPAYVQTDSWFGFTITHLHPYADIYPHFVRADLERKDGGALGEAIHPGNNFYGQPAVMLSRRTRLFGPAHPVDPVLKLLKVQQWLNTR